MASSITPKIQPQNPETKTPKNPVQTTAETQINNMKKSANLEKLKNTVMELLKAEPNMPLSEPHKARILDERLTQILSLLHSPDHPPYAWMIETAIQELNEIGGSPEESISKFIKEKYDDLPWAHDTMLNHHLAQLCASGEVILTRNRRYLLPGGDSDGKISRKSKKKKSVKGKWRGWDCGKKRSKWCGQVNRKENMVSNENVLFDKSKFLLSQRQDQLASKEVIETEEHGVEGVEQQKLKGDDDVLLLSQPKAQETSNELHEEEDWMIQGIEQQNFVDEFRKGTEILCVAEEKVVDSNSDAVPIPIVAPSIPQRKNKSENSSMHQKRTAGFTDVFSQNGRLKLGGTSFKDNQMEVSSPEKPPGFEPVTLEEVSHVHPLTAGSSELPIHPEQLNQLDEHDILNDGKAAASGLCVIEDSIPTDRMQRQMKRWRKGLSGVKAPLISDILISRESQNSELSGQDEVHIEHHTPVESTMITDVKGKLCSQQQKVLVASSETLQQPHSKALSKLPSLDRFPDEPKHHVEPSEHERKQQAAQGTQIRRVLRPRPLKPEPQLSNAITKANFSSSHDQHKRKKPESEFPGTEVMSELKISVHQSKQDLFSEGTKYEPSDVTTEGISLSKSVHDPHLEQQLKRPRHGACGRPYNHITGASSILESNLQYKRTKYRGRGRSRVTDIKY